jgi:ribosomal protein S18 acetylase RimI-like enzyme
MDLTLRRAVAGDAESVSDLYVRSRRAGAETGSIPPPVHADDEVAGWIRHVVIPKLECWVAQTSQGQVVGILVLRGEWIDQLYVDPDLTGRGIGAELLDLAKRERPRGLRLWTFVSNERAQCFYERYGFREVERTDGSGNEEQAPAIQYVWMMLSPE